MKARSTLLLLCAFMLAPVHASAQLLPDQRKFDFESIVALYAKRYAPYDWKRQALGFDLFDIKSWLNRVLEAKDDLEFFEIEAEYVGRLNDTHSSFSMTSSFRASLGFTVDIYDGKVLIDSISRGLLPSSSYPFQTGDELVSVDSVSSEDWIKRISTWRQYGNPATTRRVAAGQITYRSQNTFPRAAEIGDVASVEIRRANGNLERYTIPWNKSGLPVTTVGPVPFPNPAPPDLKRQSGLPEYLDVLDELHNYKLPDGDPILTPLPWTAADGGVVRGFVNGVGYRPPIFQSGFPSSFVQRLGRSSGDFHFSGTYTADGLTIGFLRIPSFSGGSSIVLELRNEIEYLQNNTDGLVLDVTRNPGGGCYMIDAAATLIPYPFYFFGEEIRATQDRLNSFQSQLDYARASRAEQWVIDAYQTYVDQMKAALAANRGMTPPIPACRQYDSTGAPIANGNAPLPTAYSKPMIVLIDEFSISAGEIFPAMLQDNGRALLVGMRTSGGGGSVSSWPTGFYSESLSSNTNTLVVRRNPIVTADYPAAPYVENIGARPDVTLDYMTRENLLNGGRTFVSQFTKVLEDQIRSPLSLRLFTIFDRGGVSWTSAGSAGSPVAGYGRIQGNSGNASPPGLAMFGFRQNNVLVTEATVPAAALIQSGRVFAEIDGPVNAGVAIANPGDEPATISFYFTQASGQALNGTTVVAPHGQIASFLDQPPFNCRPPFSGTFTFVSSTPVAAIALRGLTNERGEFLISTLPLVDVSRTAATGTAVLPDYADGGGWTTQIVLVNPTDSELTGAVQFLDQAGGLSAPGAGDQAAAGFTYRLAPRAAQSFKTSGSAQSAQVGSLRVVPAGNSAAPSSLAVLSFRRNGITVSEAGVQAVSGSSAFRLYAEASGAAGTPGSVQTGLAIANLSKEEVKVTLELTRLDGSSVGSAAASIPPDGQVSRFLNQFPGLASLQLPFQGVLRVSGTAPISVIGLRGRYNERNDFLITALPPVDETATPADTDMFFPHYVDGGGYTTQFILFSGLAGQQSSGALRFFSQDGNLVNLDMR